MTGEMSLSGVLFSPLLVSAIAAIVATGLLRQVMILAGLYRWVWHAALFDLAIFVLMLGVIDRLVSGGVG